MKKLIMFFMVITISIFIIGCNNKNNDNKQPKIEGSSIDTAKDEPKAEPKDEPKLDSKDKEYLNLDMIMKRLNLSRNSVQSNFEVAVKTKLMSSLPKDKSYKLDDDVEENYEAIVDKFTRDLDNNNYNAYIEDEKVVIESNEEKYVIASSFSDTAIQNLESKEDVMAVIINCGIEPFGEVDYQKSTYNEEYPTNIITILMDDNTSLELEKIDYVNDNLVKVDTLDEVISKGKEWKYGLSTIIPEGIPSERISITGNDLKEEFVLSYQGKYSTREVYIIKK